MHSAAPGAEGVDASRTHHVKDSRVAAPVAAERPQSADPVDLEWAVKTSRLGARGKSPANQPRLDSLVAGWKMGSSCATSPFSSDLTSKQSGLRAPRDGPPSVG